MAEQSLKEKTAKGLFWGGISNGVQQFFSILFGLALARLLNASDYGMIGMLGVFMGISTVLMDSGFSTALINRKEIKHEDYNAVFWFSFSVGCLCYIILFLCAPLIAKFFGHPELTALSRVLFLWFLFGSTAIAHSAMLTKKLMVKERMKIEVSALLISGTIGIVMAYKGFAYWGIAIQTVTHGFVGTALRWYYVKWRPTFSFDFRPLKNMFSFGVKIMFTSIFSQINANIFSVLLGKFYNEDQVGYYTQGNKWMTMGYSFISSMVGNVSLPVLTEVASDIDRQRQVFRKMLRFVAFIAFPAMFGLAFVSRELIIIGVSAKWLPCVPVMQLLCVWGAFNPLSNLYTHVLLSHGKSDIYLYNTVALGFLQLIVLFATLSFGIYYMVMAFVVVNVLWVGVWHYFVWRCIHLKLFDALKDTLPFLLITLSTLGLTYFLVRDITNIYLLFIAKILIAAVIYLAVMKGLKVVVLNEVLDFLRKKFKGKI